MAEKLTNEELLLRPTHAWAAHAFDTLWTNREPFEEARTFRAADGQQRVYHILLHKMDWTKKEPFFIREDYRDAFNFISSPEVANEAREGQGGVVIWGQPGIGKSLYLRYHLARALSNQLPVLFVPQLRRWYFFGPNGPRVIEKAEETDALRLAEDYPGLLSLIDTTVAMPTLPPDFDTMPILPVQATSPLEARYKEWRKHRLADVWVMDPWSLSEVEEEASAIEEQERQITPAPQNPSSTTTRTPIELTQLAGPVPRAIFPLKARQFSEEKNRKAFREVIRTVLKSAQLSVLFAAMAAGNEAASPESGGYSAVSNFHRVFKVSRKKSMPNPQRWNESPSASSWASVSCISPFVEEELKILYAEKVLQDQLSFASKFGPAPQVAGLVYEAAAVNILATATSNKYHGTLFDSVPSRLSFPAQPSPAQPILVSIPELSSLSSSPVNLIPNQLYVPQQGYPTFDAFVETNETVILLQMTIAKKHSVKASGIRRLKKVLQRSLPWCLIFVVPSKDVGEKLVTPARRCGIKVGTVALKFGYLVLSKVSMDTPDSTEHADNLASCAEDLLIRLESADVMDVDED